MHHVVAAVTRRQEERISVPATGVHGDRQQPKLEIQIRAGRVCLPLDYIPYQDILNWKQFKVCVYLYHPNACMTGYMSHELFANLTSFTVSLFRQLILIIELYNHYDVYDYLRQIALTLCSDKVSEVRWISYKLVSERRYWNLC